MRQERKERRREYFFQVQIIISNFSAVYILIISILKNTPTNWRLLHPNFSDDT